MVQTIATLIDETLMVMGAQFENLGELVKMAIFDA